MNNRETFKVALLFAAAGGACGLLLRGRPGTGALLHAVGYFVATLLIWPRVSANASSLDERRSRGALAGAVIGPLGAFLGTILVLSYFPEGIPGSFTFVPPLDSFGRIVAASFVDFWMGFMFFGWIQIPLCMALGCSVAKRQGLMEG